MNLCIDESFSALTPSPKDQQHPYSDDGYSNIPIVMMNIKHVSHLLTKLSIHDTALCRGNFLGFSYLGGLQRTDTLALS